MMNKNDIVVISKLFPYLRDTLPEKAKNRFITTTTENTSWVSK